VTREVAGQLFGVCGKTAGIEFDTWMLAIVAYKRTRFGYPSTEQSRRSCPTSIARDYDSRNVTWFLDASELIAQVASDQTTANTMWSSYKSRHTVKLLGALHISGAMLYTSAGYPGGITDFDVTKVSGFLDILQPDDIVVADKGFLVFALIAKAGAKLVIPPKRKAGQAQLSASQCLTNAVIARTRIHVERAFRHIKTYRYFNASVDIKSLDMFDVVFEACAFLTTLKKPLVPR
jgi:hypothetical protein